MPVELRKLRRATGALPWLALGLFVAATSLGWASRSLEPGDKAPEISLPDAAGSQVVLAEYAGKPMLLVFWAAKNPVMEDHSWEVLAACQEVAQEFSEHGLEVLAIRFPPHGEAAGVAQVQRPELGFPMLAAADNSVYSAYGLFILPTTVILDSDHTVKRIIGYTQGTADKLGGAVAVMLGFLTAAEVEAELHPERVEVPPWIAAT